MTENTSTLLHVAIMIAGAFAPVLMIGFINAIHRLRSR